MLKKRTLAIVGRPNVGKSALFNRIAGKRVAIVDEMEGVTRDRISLDVEAFGTHFRMLDTGGIDPRSQDRFKKEIIAQTHLAIEEADSLIMVVDGKTGITKLDEELALLLLKTQKPLTLAVNKIDSEANESAIYPFYRLGIKEVIGISATHGTNIEMLLHTAWKEISFPDDITPPEKQPTKIAIVGRPNVGKSTFVNALLGTDRAIVSPLAGTTRDALDLPFTAADKDYLLIDTAGLIRKKSHKEVVDKLAHLRTKRAIERADLVLLLLDAEKGLTEQEKRIAADIEECGKSCIILLNKWDLVKGFRMEHCLKGLNETTPFLAALPILVISAQTKRNLEKILPAIEEVLEAQRQRLSTHQLNKFLKRVMTQNPPTMLKGKRLRVYYMTQVGEAPPKFIFFVNNTGLMQESYKKYLANQLRKEFGFKGVPLELYLKGKRAPAPSPARNAWEEEEYFEEEVIVEEADEEFVE